MSRLDEDEQTDERTDGRTDGRADGRTDGKTSRRRGKKGRLGAATAGDGRLDPKEERAVGKRRDSAVRLDPRCPDNRDCTSSREKRATGFASERGRRWMPAVTYEGRNVWYDRGVTPCYVRDAAIANRTRGIAHDSRLNIATL